MINERMTFRLKYGKEKEAANIWVEMLQAFPEIPGPRDVRFRNYKNLSGRTNCLTQDFLIKSLSEHNPMMYYWKINPRVQEAYAKFAQLCDTSMREILNIEYEAGTVKNFKDLIVERSSFRLFFGKARDSIALWKEIIDEAKNSGGPHLRMMTDIAGESYTLEVEAYFKNVTDINLRKDFWAVNEKMNSLYQKFIPLCYMAERNYFLVDYDY